MQFQLETVESWYADAPPLIYEHWQELGLDTDLKGDIAVEKLKLLEGAGLWLTMTVRDEGKLVGYIVGVFSTHLHYQSSGKMFIADMYYVMPEYRRGIGAQMLAFMESTVRDLGAIKIYLSCKVHRDNTKLFQRMGYRLSDFAFTKRTG